MQKRLSDLISPAFYELHHAIKSGTYRHIMMKGGRGSTKSSLISIEIVLGMLRDPKAHTVVMRKVGDTIRDSVYAQMLWAIDVLGLGYRWQAKVSPMELVDRLTGQKILFRSSHRAEDRDKIKSIKVPKGAIKFVWFEELQQFDGMEELRSILQSMIRGTDEATIFYSFNPPKTSAAWVNAEAKVTRDDRIVHHSTYLSVPRNWLGEQFIAEAEALKAINPTAYDHEYMGEEVGTGGEIFTNVQIRPISEDEIKLFDNKKRGLDYGFAVDPMHYGEMHYDRKYQTLYIYREIHGLNMTNQEAYNRIKPINPDNEPIVADSAEPKSNTEMRRFGLKIIPSKKGADSIDYGIKFLQSLHRIIIDDRRCPNTAREFQQYEYERDAHGNFKAGYPGKDNHSIDMTRYALNTECLAFRDKHKRKTKSKEQQREEKYRAAITGDSADAMKVYTDWG